MKRIEKINSTLEEVGIRVEIDKVHPYGTFSTIRYHCYLMYFNAKKNRWGVFHNVGVFSDEKAAIDAAEKKLRMDKYL